MKLFEAILTMDASFFSKPLSQLECRDNKISYHLLEKKGTHPMRMHDNNTTCNRSNQNAGFLDTTNTTCNRSNQNARLPDTHSRSTNQHPATPDTTKTMCCRSAAQCWKAFLVTGVCLSTRGRCTSPRQTPSQADTPRQTPSRQTPPGRWPLQWTVHILLECILINKNAFHWDAYRLLQWPSREGVSACLGGVCPGGVSAVCQKQPPPTVDRILDTRLWKHYLSATTVADGNEC